MTIMKRNNPSIVRATKNYIIRELRYKGCIVEKITFNQNGFIVDVFNKNKYIPSIVFECLFCNVFINFLNENKTKTFNGVETLSTQNKIIQEFIYEEQSRGAIKTNVNINNFSFVFSNIA